MKIAGYTDLESNWGDGSLQMSKLKPKGRQFDSYFLWFKRLRAPFADFAPPTFRNGSALAIYGVRLESQISRQAAALFLSEFAPELRTNQRFSIAHGPILSSVILTLSTCYFKNVNKAE